MWFMHNGTPAYFSFAVREYLNDTFTEQSWETSAVPTKTSRFESSEFWGYLKLFVIGR